jgi:hypothetical protein
MSYDDWKLQSPPEEGEVEPCPVCGEIPSDRGCGCDGR